MPSLRQIRRFVLSLLMVPFLGAASGFSATPLVERSVGTASIRSIQPTDVADLVLLQAGFSDGFRQGMLCNVFRNDAVIGSLLIVDLRPHFSTALIVNLSTDKALQPGDLVVVKTHLI